MIRMVMRLLKVVRWRNCDPDVDAFIGGLRVAERHRRKVSAQSWRIAGELIEQHLSPSEIDAIRKGAAVTKEAFA